MLYESSNDDLELRLSKNRWCRNMSNELWPECNAPLTPLTDVEFRCKDGSVRAHRNYLMIVSPLIRDFVNERPELYLLSDMVIVVKDFEAELVKKFLQLVYLGKTNLTDMSKLREVEDFASKHLGIVFRGNVSLIDSSKSSEISKETALSPGIEHNNLQASDEVFESFESIDEPSSTVESSFASEGLSGDDSLCERLTFRQSLPSDSGVKLEAGFEEESALKREVKREREYIKRESKYEEDRLFDDEVAKRCRFCNLTFSKYSKLISHFESLHPKQNPFGCTRCEKNFTRKFDLLLHLKSRHGNIKPIRCDTCGERFKSRHSRRKHQRLAHGLDLLNGSAAAENKLFLKKTGCHEREEMLQMFKPDPGQHESESGIKCQKCSVVVEDENEAIAHYQNVHKFQVIGICQQCHFYYISEKSQTAHLKLHDPTRPYGCPVCNLRFSQSETLDRHVIAVHEKSRPHTCSICSKSFGIRSTLIKHIQMVHNKNLELKGSFKKRSADDSGVGDSSGTDSVIQSEGKRNKQTEGEYQCFHCHQTFPYKFELQDHVELCQFVGTGPKGSSTDKAIEETLSHLDDISKELNFIFQEPSSCS